MSIFSEKRLAADLAVQVRLQTTGQRWRNMLIIFATLSLGLIGNFVFDKIEIAASLWTITLLAIADLIFTLERLRRTPIAIRILMDSIVVGLLWLPSYPFAHNLYRSQHAALFSGVLRTPSDNKDHSHERPLLSAAGVQIYPAPGSSIAKYAVPQNDVVTVARSGNELLVSTTVRDSLGNLIVEIVNNRWRVSRSDTDCWDKNYNDNTLEVKDGRGRVVLRLQVNPTYVFVEGEWPKLDAVIGGSDYSEAAGISPVFKYPSSDYWGEYLQ